MVKLDRYIGSSVFMAIIAVLAIILGLATLFAFIDEMGDVSDTYTLVDVLGFVVLTAPRRLYEMLPMAALIGCLIGLGSLASSSELTVMRAAGVSIGRIVWAVMKPMLVLMLAGVLIGEYVAPATESMAQANGQEDAVNPPQPQRRRDLAFFEGAARGNQDAQVSHIKKNRRQQLEETALTWIDPRQRHRHQGHDEHQQRQGQTPLQLSARTNVIAADQGTGGHCIAVGDFVADVRLGQQYAVFLVLDRPVVGLPRVTVVAIAVVENQVAIAVRADFLTTLLGHQHGDPAILLIGRDVLLRNEHATEVDAIIRQRFGVGHPSPVT